HDLFAYSTVFYYVHNVGIGYGPNRSYRDHNRILRLRLRDADRSKLAGLQKPIYVLNFGFNRQTPRLGVQSGRNADNAARKISIGICAGLQRNALPDSDLSYRLL